MRVRKSPDLKLLVFDDRLVRSLGELLGIPGIRVEALDPPIMRVPVRQVLRI